MDLLNRLLIITIMSLFMLNLCNASNKTSDEAPDKNVFMDFMAEMWVDGAQMAKLLWLDCSSKAALSENDTLTTIERYHIFTKCLKKKTLKALDRSLNNDIISIGDGIQLLRYQRVSQNGDIIHENNNDTSLTDKEIDNNYWQYLVLKRMAKVLSSHVLKVDLSPKDAYSPEAQAQRGRRRFQMMQMMIFGMVSLGMIIIPMGFQFLAVLGGKALLIAKFALILSSIQGLRKSVCKTDESTFVPTDRRGSYKNYNRFNGYSYF